MNKKFLIVLSSMLIVSCAPEVSVLPVNQISDQEEGISAVYYPINNFDTGVSLKPFGIYISPKTSPVQPERFAGYHTGADVEIPESLQVLDVPVYSIADGVVKLLRSASGYGGVMVVEHGIGDQFYIAVYGHIDLNSVSAIVGEEVFAGQQLAILGEGFSVKTDGERKHLHFALKPGTVVDLKGYVNSKSDLDDWIDPVEFFKARNAIKPEEPTN